MQNIKLSEANCMSQLDQIYLIFLLWSDNLKQHRESSDKGAVNMSPNGSRTRGESWLNVLERAARQIRDQSREIEGERYVLLAGLSANTLIKEWFIRTGCIERIGIIHGLPENKVFEEVIAAYSDDPAFGRRLRNRCLYLIHPDQLNRVVDRTLLEGYRIVSCWGGSGVKLDMTPEGKTQAPDEEWGKDNSVI